MKRVLITGATGFTGKHLVKRLKNTAETHIIVRPASLVEQPEFKDSALHVYTHDGTTKSMLEIVAQARPDVVFHLASNFIAEHKSDDVETLIFGNILFGAQLLEAAAKYNICYFINTGTFWQHYKDEAYNPVNLYAATKQAFEDFAQYYIQSTPLRMITLKLFDTYGPNDPRPKLLSLFKRCAETGEELKMSLGYQQLGLVYIDDVIDAFLCAAEKICMLPEHQMVDYAVAPQKFYTLRQIAHIYEQVSGKKLNILWGARPYRAREVMKPFVGKRLPDWQEKIDLYEGIKKCWREGQS